MNRTYGASNRSLHVKEVPITCTKILIAALKMNWAHVSGVSTTQKKTSRKKI